jgi:hypothetical protein
MNFSRIRSELAKVQEFAAECARRGQAPLTIVVLPGNSRGPNADGDLPLPRIAWHDECATCVLYDVKVGQPDADTIERLIEGVAA